MQILNIAGYKFISLMDLAALKQHLSRLCKTCALKGTILLSEEGINITLAGTQTDILHFKADLYEDVRFADIVFHETYSEEVPFRQLKIKIKKEIITFRTAQVSVQERAPSVTPVELKKWLDNNRDITLLDTRNDYEVRFGTFKKATHLNIKDFSDFANQVEQVKPEKPVVLFCTGGIRCEKAALYMLKQGYNEVYQLESGILGYFAQVGGKHYHGECFVFDDRIAVDTNLEVTGTLQCQHCQGPVTKANQMLPNYVPGSYCHACTV